MEIFTCVMLILLAYLIITYNMFMEKKNDIKEIESTINRYLIQKFDLIPSLIDCIKEFMVNEKQTLLNITLQRENFLISGNLKEGQKLNIECKKMVTLAEKFPELRNNSKFSSLKKSLIKLEHQLQTATKIYNIEVNNYNNKVKKFPSNIIANIFGFNKEDLFEVDEEKNNENEDVQD